MSQWFQVVRQNRVTAVAAALVLLLAGIACWSLCSPEAEPRLEAIRQHGYPVTLAELDAWYRPVPEAENAALVYLKAFAQLNLTNAQSGPGWFSGSDWLPKRGQPVAAEDQVELAALLATNAPALTLLYSGAALKRSRYPVDLKEGLVAQLPHLSQVKQAVLLLGAQALAQAAAGETEKATQALLAAGRAADSLAEEPMLISQLVRLACWGIIVARLEQVVDLSSLEERQLGLLEQMLREGEQPRAWARGLAGERACGLAVFLSQKSQQEWLWPEEAAGGASTGQRLGMKLCICALKTTGFFQKDKAFYLDVMATNMAAVEFAFPARLQLGLRTVNLVPPSRLYVFSRMLLPALSKAFTREAEAAARLRVAQTALAVERFRRAHGQALPAALEALAPSYLKCVPEDPFDGKPLRFKARGSGYVLYSMGKDGQDNDGLERNPNTPNAPQDITFILER